MATGLKCRLPNRISFGVFDRCFCKVETRACETLRSCAMRLRGLAVTTLPGASRSFNPALIVAQGHLCKMTAAAHSRHRYSQGCFFTETFRSFVRNSVKLSCHFFSFGYFLHDFKRPYDRIDLSCFGHLKKIVNGRKITDKNSVREMYLCTT